MNPKYQKVCAEIAKTEKKVEDLQGQLKELYDKKTELENLKTLKSSTPSVRWSWTRIRSWHSLPR